MLGDKILLWCVLVFTFNLLKLYTDVNSPDKRSAGVSFRFTPQRPDLTWQGNDTWGGRSSNISISPAPLSQRSWFLRYLGHQESWSSGLRFRWACFQTGTWLLTCPPTAGQQGHLNGPGWFRSIRPEQELIYYGRAACQKVTKLCKSFRPPLDFRSYLGLNKLVLKLWCVYHYCIVGCCRVLVKTLRNKCIRPL